MTYGTKQTGSLHTTEMKTYITHNGKVVSPFHDIPLYDGDHVRCVNEIPRFAHGKLEINKEEAFNPIMQDVKKGKLRYIKNIYPSFGYPFNYGALPQTWEDPTVDDVECCAKGDNDPIDVVEIGSRQKEIGEVYSAKVIGVLGLLDDGEADWKVIVLDTKDELAASVNDIGDVAKIHPQLLDNIYTWFRDYKMPEKNQRNAFALEGEFKDAEFAKKVIAAGHESWNKLVRIGHKGINLASASLKDCDGYNSDFNVEGTKGKDGELPENINEYSYVI